MRENDRPQFSLRALLVLVFLVACLLGVLRLGGGPVPVTGRVYFRGQPVTNSNLLFRNLRQGKDRLAFTWGDGCFRFPDGCPPGDYRVGLIQGVVFPQGTKESAPRLPQKLCDPATSGFTVRVFKLRENHFILDLR